MSEDLVFAGADTASDDILDVPFEVKTCGTEIKEDGTEVGTFTGMASTFGNVDLVGDRIAPGAFTQSIKNPRKIRMLWQHDIREPIGVWREMRETDKGLEVKGALVLDVRRAAEAHALMKEGALDAMSIGFRVPSNGWEIDKENQGRLLTKIDLLEVSLVTFPANPKARVQRVKSIQTIREFETFLRDVAGFSHGRAKSVAAHGFKEATDPRDEADELNGLLSAFRKRIAASRA